MYMASSLPSLLILVFLLPYLFVESVSFDDASGTVSLNISLGELLGKRIDAYDNRTGYGFLGVPFGAPAVGPLRFAKPVAASPWDGVRNVTVKGDACPAIPQLTYKTLDGGPMSEDCLHSYVYASKNCLVKGGCPIMWVLHGGGYNFESPVVFIDEVIVHNFASDGQDVVVIIPAYRLENFGFLNIAPGMNTSAVANTAVWDLLLAMQWTHREAHHFGGDADKITIFGHSAGSTFADIISTSPHFEGLFRGLVLMSGADTTFEAGIEFNKAASWATARILKCADNATNQTDVVAVEKVIECMRGKKWEEIVEANIILSTHPEDYRGPHADGPGGILSLAPSILARARRPISVMLGCTSKEMRSTKYALTADGTADLNKVAELCEGYGYGTAYARPDVMTKMCLDYYMQGKNILNLHSDVGFFVPTYKVAKDFAEKGSKVYLYSFTYQGVGDAFKEFMPVAKEDRPGHSEDYVYILGMHRGNFTARDYEIEKIYSGMVLNFVKTGYPNPGADQPAWKPFKSSSSNYYEIDFDDNMQMPGMEKGFAPGAVKLWANDVEKYAGPITPPEDFPPQIDQFFQREMISACASHYTNASTSMKTVQVEQNNYKMFIEYIKSRRFKYLQGLKSVRSITVELPTLEDIDDVESNMIMEILVICVSALLIFLLFRCGLHIVSKQRKGYEQL